MKLSESNRALLRSIADNDPTLNPGEAEELSDILERDAEQTQQADANYTRGLAARDAAIAFAHRVEDAFGQLVQVHHVGPNGEREMCVQFPNLGGFVTELRNIGFVVARYPLSKEQKAAGWTVEALTQDAPQFVMAKK